MFHFKILIITVLVVCALSDDDESKEKGDEGKGKWKHHEKIQKCMKQTMELQNCCPYMKDESTELEFPECKEHLEGVEEMSQKEQGKALKCFVECLFKQKGILVDDEIHKEALIEAIQADLVARNQVDFEGIALSSVDYCMGEFEAMKQKWKTWKGDKGDKKKDDDKDDEKKHCNMKPLGLSMCILGNVVRNCPESQWNNDGNGNCTIIKADSMSMEDCMKF